MVNKFTFWLESIVEDDPLPDEINSILFKVDKNGGYKFIKLLGYSGVPNVNKIAYFPLEAQFFLDHTLAKQPTDKFLFNAKYIIEECFNSLILKKQFKGKKIYFQFNNVVEYLFKINQ